MADYDNTNRFVLFKNDKEGNEKRPDYTGSIDVDGTEYWMSAWIKDGKKGKFMSGQIELKEEKKKPAKKTEQEQNDDFDDMSDIPF